MTPHTEMTDADADLAMRQLAGMVPIRVRCDGCHRDGTAWRSLTGLNGIYEIHLPAHAYSCTSTMGWRIVELVPAGLQAWKVV